VFCTMKAVLVLLVLLAASAYSQGVICDGCLSAIGVIESFVTENTTETQVIVFLEQFCNFLPSPYNQACIQGIADDGPLIIQQILNFENPHVVCAQLTLCNSSSIGKSKQVPKQSKVKVVPKVQTRDVPCDTCVYVVKAIESFVAQNSTEQEIEDYLTQVICPLLGIDSSSCALVASQIPAIVDLLESGATPQVVCQTLAFCTNPPPAVTAVKAPLDLNCDICVFAVGQIEDYIASNATETEIEKALDGACSLLGPLYQQCVDIVAGLPTYIAELEQYETPQVVCAQVGVCTSSSKKFKH